MHWESLKAVSMLIGISTPGFGASKIWPWPTTSLAHHIKEVFENTYRCYGSPRIVKALSNRGLRCGRTRVQRLMKQEGLCPRQKRRFRPQTTQSHPCLPCAPNVVTELPPAPAPAQRFHSDITYIPTKEGFVYLAATIDAFTRRCAGWCLRDNLVPPRQFGASETIWCLRDNMETSLVKEAALMAFGEKSDAQRLHHSDRGSQYTSEDFRSLLAKESIVQSMSRKGNCYDNALSESFWATVKTECFDNFRSEIPSTKAQVVRSLFHYIELFYNRERLHCALGYKSPVQFEDDWTHDHCTENVST
ncbi:hypothetical protein EON83_13570 [bacterium]|nr:MAG: hypothetical protein EON83_13570 [bacterium]